jgi:hypothetical protein
MGMTTQAADSHLRPRRASAMHNSLHAPTAVSQPFPAIATLVQSAIAQIAGGQR